MKEIRHRSALLCEQVRQLLALVETTFEKDIVFRWEVEGLAGLLRLSFSAMHNLEVAGSPNDFKAEWHTLRARVAFLAFHFSPIRARRQNPNPTNRRSESAAA